jgi:hypothetical protein
VFLQAEQVVLVVEALVTLMQHIGLLVLAQQTKDSVVAQVATMLVVVLDLVVVVVVPLKLVLLLLVLVEKVVMDFLHL